MIYWSITSESHNEKIRKQQSQRKTVTVQLRSGLFVVAFKILTILGEEYFRSKTSGMRSMALVR